LNDKNNTTLVVEGIPPGIPPLTPTDLDKMNEPTIHAWFSQFGPIAQILIDSSWGKAILVYADYESAAKAWNDPRPVFDNRFVKIWWKKTEEMDKEMSGSIVDEVELEVAREAAKKAQKEHEEKQRRKMELEKKKEELERQRVALVEKQRVEREKLLEKIKRAQEKAKAKNTTATNGTTKTVMTTISTTSPPTTTNDEETSQSTTDEVSRKAHLQKMLSDLQIQVSP
jgi:RNA-binding protein 26